MKVNPQELIEFAFKLIDIQIKKYNKLADFGVGPDAKASAGLIRLEVVDLSTKLDNFLKQPDISEQEFVKFSQVIKFYLDCEYLRGRAGWLLDENPIHNTVYKRVAEQLQELEEIAKYFEGWQALKKPTSEQQSHLHHSHAIAFRILDLVAKLKEDPDRKDLGADNNLSHGLNIMRNHARENGRYHQKDIGQEINVRHAESKLFLEDSSISIDKEQLCIGKKQATSYLQEDRKAFKQLFNLFLEKYPKTPLAQKDFKWFNVAKLNTDTSQKHEGRQSCSLLKWGLFGIGAVTVGTGVAYAMMDSNQRQDIAKMFGIS